MTDKLIEQLRDEDSYYRVQEKHWCIDAEELERQRQAAADRIEAQAAEIYGLRKALGWFVNDVRFTVQVGGNPLTVPGMIDAATKIYFGETLHVPETCKENGETFT